MAKANILNLLETVREDDYVEYHLFPNISCNDLQNNSEEFYLSKCLTQVQTIVEKYCATYLWHKDKFNVVLRETSNQMLLNDEHSIKDSMPSHLYGIIHYGDNIEDEWFLVYLLLQLTKEIDGLVARVVDSDGEFLLIEAANFLPTWATPETCEKRVYLFGGKVHIIPLNQTNSQDDVEILEALNCVLQEPLVTVASYNIQNAISNRTAGYPEKIPQQLHRAKVYLPVGVAAILKHEPQLISNAVLAFCNRDPIDMKACKAMKYFPPENRVYSSVQFTKCLYAMLHHSKYNPDRKIGWNLPNVTTSAYKSHNLGIKIACGLEILAAQAKNPDDKAWNLYLQSLKDKNYFDDNLEHSQEYNNLLNRAKEYFKSQKVFSSSASDVGLDILDLNRELEYCKEDFEKLEASLPEDDPETWLEISVQELDKMLTERYGQQNNFLNANGHIDANNLTAKLTEFLDNVSGVEGAEFPEENPPPVRPQRGVKRNKENATTLSKETEANNKINFDPSNFSCAVQNILDLVIPEDSWDLDSDSEMSEYADESDSELERIDDTKVKSKMMEYMEQMDRELAGTNIGKSFERKPPENDTFDDIETFKPVDIDMTALKNILESYQSQLGGAGPASNLLGPMGVHLEQPSSSNIDK